MPIGVVNEAVVQLEASVGVRTVHFDISRPQTRGPTINVVGYQREDDAARVWSVMSADTEVGIARHAVYETCTLVSCELKAKLLAVEGC